MSTDTTNVASAIYAEYINEAILDYAHDFTVTAGYLNWLDLRGRNTNVGSFPRMTLNQATDIADENTDLAQQDLVLTDFSITAAEIGVRRDVTDAAIEQNILGAQLFDLVVRDSGVLFGISLEEDICALFAGFTSSVGVSGAALTLANMVEAQAEVRQNGMRGQLVYILDDKQAADYQSAQAASTSTTVNDFFSVSVGIENGYLGTFMGAPVWQTGLCADANAGADKVGGCFIRGDLNPRQAALGGVMARDVRTETERDASFRKTEVVSTAKWGVGELCDEAGCSIITAA